MRLSSNGLGGDSSTDFGDWNIPITFLKERGLTYGMRIFGSGLVVVLECLNGPIRTGRAETRCLEDLCWSTPAYSFFQGGVDRTVT